MTPATAGGPHTVRCAAAGRVHEILALVREPGFVARCAARYRAAGFGEPGESEIRSWRASWPPLLDALLRAGCGDLWLYLEYGTPGGGQRLDALLLGHTETGVLGLVVIELKQWQRAQVLDAERVRRPDGLVTPHPVHQVRSYLDFFRFWRPAEAPALELRGTVLLHNATRAQAEGLRDRDGDGPLIPIVTGDDLTANGNPLAAALGCTGLKPPAAQEVRAFEGIAWVPSERLLAQVGGLLRGQTVFPLLGAQFDAFVRIRSLVSRMLDRTDTEGAVIAVTGGPGSGKTVLAVHLLGHLMQYQAQSRPRFTTPSGTLRAHLLDAADGHPQARDLFPSVASLHSAARTAGTVIVDEAQRMTRLRGSMPPELASVIRQVRLVVVFLDERQTVRPGEGTTVTEIEATARAAGRRYHHLELKGSFRCNGSAAYTNWVDNLLYGTPTVWRTHREYGLHLCEDPFQLQEVIDHATAAGHTARTAAGFCWSWPRTNNRTGPPSLDIEITTRTTGRPRVWKAAWNASTTRTGPDGATIAPRSQLWATHTSGHQQIGCIYSAQGVEYRHAGVIIGPDLTWTTTGWTAHPDKSHDAHLRDLTPEEYLPYALNIYRVLLTRGTHTTHIHATDPDTHRMLTSLIPPTH
ncbi:DNA/RNA helicase domain-containing protein [Streptomyces sp. NPDC057638]|uniref:DNA/RNA helicase domain-containing protein n=1 Tax=Streptomyces sp. NPDC057638 TaxID=3346190 RepID=UPI003699A656